MQVFEVTGRLLYREAGRNPNARTDKGLVDLRQVRNMQQVVRAARAERRISVDAARQELVILQEMYDALIKGPLRQVGCRYVREDLEMKVRPQADEITRKRRRAEREARKLGRSQRKKKKKRKR